MIVIDASLATKWLVQEADHDEALRFLRRFRTEMAAPDLLLTEVSSGIVRRANMCEITAADAKERILEWIALWSSGPIMKYRLIGALVADAAQLALQLGHPLADCVYLALAIELDCELATCDARFHAKAAPHHPRVKLLAEFS